MPNVSVIVPVYNVEKYIDKCLNSLVNQSLESMEIIIVNDGSTDGSEKTINDYLMRFPEKIKYYKKENGGLSSARNYGLKFAKGEYVAFLDSDDYVEPDMYKIMFDKAVHDNADMVECDFLWEYKKQRKDKRRIYKNKKEMIKKPRVVAWNKLIKKEIIENNNIRFPEGLIYEDLEFFCKIFPYLNKISYVEEYFVHYVQREDSILNSQNEKIRDIFEILDNVICYYIEAGLYDEYKKELNYMCKRILLGSSMKRILRLDNGVLKRRLIKATFERVAKNNYYKQKNVLKKNNETLQHLVFGITKMDIGGAERVLADMANCLCKKYDITIFTIYRNGKLERELDKRVKVEGLYNKKNKIIPLYLFLFGRYVYNKNIKNRFDIEIAFLEGPITRIFSHKGTSGKIAWVHNDIRSVFGCGFKAELKNKIDKMVYKKYNIIVFVSEDNKKAFNKLYGENFNEKVIYNYIDKNRVLKKSEEYTCNMHKNSSELVVLIIARLVKQKGIDRAIRVHKKLIDEGILHKFYVIGDGQEKENLQKLILDLNVEDSFILLGEKENPYPYLKECDYFALLSYYEGYGMVIEEAKIFNKTIIATNTAAKEALKDYKKGIIVENDEKDIYFGLKNMLQGDFEK